MLNLINELSKIISRITFSLAQIQNLWNKSKILLKNFFPIISLKSKLELETSMTPSSFSISDLYQTWIRDILAHFQERKNSWDPNIQIKIEIIQTRESLVDTIRVDFLWKWTRILHHLFKEKLIDFLFNNIL